MSRKSCTCNNPTISRQSTCRGGRNAMASHVMSASINAMKVDVLKGKPTKYLGGITLNVNKRTVSARTKYKL